VSRIGQAGSPPGQPYVPNGSWTQDARRSASQLTLWLAMSLPWNWWTRLFLPILPIMAEQLARSGFQHKSGRYLGFMPPTALYRAMHPPVPGPTQARLPMAG